METKNVQNQLLDLIAAMRGLDSDYKLARHMGIPLQTLRNYRKNKTNMNATQCARVARELSMDPLQVIARVKCDSTDDPKIVEVWEPYLGRLLLESRG